SMTTTFENKGDHYVLKGKKHWIGNGTFANVLTTYAKDPNSGKISAFIVEHDTPGLRAEEMKNKMGLLTVKNAEIYFDNCLVPKNNLLGKKGQGLKIAYSALIDGRLSVADGAVGVMEDCLQECVADSKVRKMHGSILSSNHLIKEHYARLTVNITNS